MKRPRSWLRWLLLIGVLLVVSEYAALSVVAPRAIIRALERRIGGAIAIRKAQLAFPLTTSLTGLRLVSNTPESALAIPRVIIRPHWFSVPQKTLWVDAIEIHQPVLRITRSPTGRIMWPTFAAPAIAPRESPGPVRRMPLAFWGASPWCMRINSLKVIDGTVELIDEKLAAPFHGAIDHVSIEMGPVVIPIGNAQTSFAFHGQFIGAGGHAAPLYCSGWADLAAKDLQAACQLEPLPLAALEPYYVGPLQVRVYGTTLKVTSQWLARSNALKSRVQWELGNLIEGNLSIHGRHLIDVKKLEPAQRHLSGEVDVSGALDTPDSWTGVFLPGDDQIQALVHRLLEHGVKMIKLALWNQELRVRMEPASKETMTEIEAASKEVSEALEILAAPTPEELAPAAPLASPEAPAESSPSAVPPEPTPQPSSSEGAPAPPEAPPQDQ